MEHNSLPGVFLAFEGIDGGGKSAQLTRARNFLMACGANFISVKEPTDPLIYDLLNGRHPTRNFKDMDQLERQGYYFRDRIQHYRNTVIPALQSGKNVISDRSLVSVALDVEKDGDLEMLMAAEEKMFAEAEVPFIRPDLVLIYDVPVEVAMERLGKKQRNLDFFERADKIARTREAYREFAVKFPGFCFVIDATDTEEAVFKRYTRPLLHELLRIEEWK